jgi:hypothetical protein
MRIKEAESTIDLSTAILAEFTIDCRFEEYKIDNRNPT